MFNGSDLTKATSLGFRTDDGHTERRRRVFSRSRFAFGIAVCLVAMESSALAQSDLAAGDPPAVPAKIDDFTLARKVLNPISSLTDFSLVDNTDFGGGPNRNGTCSTLKIEPIIPFALDEHWKLVSRLTIPWIDQRNIIPGTSQDGLGDATEKLLLSPAKANALGMNWGFGPAFLLPTATDHLGFDRWGAGPAAAVNWRQGAWMASVLTYQIFSVAGGGTHSIDTVTIQPSLSYIFPTTTTLTLSADSVYDWRSAQYTCPLNTTVYQLVKIGDQPVNFGAGFRYYVARPEGAAQWGLRCSVTFLFPMSR